MKGATPTPAIPLHMIAVNRLLVALVILLAFLSGYFHARLTNEQKKYSELAMRCQAETQF